MRSLLTYIFLCALFSALIPSYTLAAQSSGRERGQGYAFVGFGAINSEESTLHFGMGGEVNLYKGLGAGIEIGYLSATQYLGSGVGILSLDGQYTFRTGSASKLRPFLTGGYTLAFRAGHANAANFGGGVHYWFRDHVGLRLEFRDHVSTAIWNYHAWQGRVGFDFR